MNGIDAYPLHWPVNQPRTNNKESARFKSTFGKARDSLMSEIKRLGGRNIILSTNIPLRNDGLPYANFRTPEDKGVAVYFEYRKKPMCFACDKWDKIEDNVIAIKKTIEAIRGIERWGSSDMLEKAFAGFAALPEASENWWEVLKIPRNSSLDSIKSQRNSLAKEYHPDSGINPNAVMMAKINKAYEEAYRERS